MGNKTLSKTSLISLLHIKIITLSPCLISQKWKEKIKVLKMWKMRVFFLHFHSNLGAKVSRFSQHWYQHTFEILFFCSHDDNHVMFVISSLSLIFDSHDNENTSIVGGKNLFNGMFVFNFMCLFQEVFVSIH